ncbi:MAG: hypothetical protein AAF242_11985 [Bacteroidota bacterium]
MIKVTSDYIIDLNKVQNYLDSDAWESDSGPRRAQDFTEEDQLRYSLDGLLNDYYEDEIKEIPEAKRAQARLFIEDGLIVAGRRVGMLEGVEKELFKIDDTLLTALLDSRLIRVENTHLGRSFEVSHDALVDPILKSKRERNALEEIEENRQRIRAVRRRLAISSIVAIVSLSLLALSIVLYFQAKSAKDSEEQQRIESENNFAKFKKEQIKATRTRYSSFVNSGKSYMNDQEYLKAINEFQKAIETIDFFEEGFSVASARDSIDNNGQEALELMAEAKARSGLEANFNELMDRGNALKRRGRYYYVNAKGVFNEALALGYDDSRARGALNELDGLLKSAFRQFKDEGDVFFRAEAWQDALNMYNQANRIKSDSTVKGQIQKCKANL